MTDFEVLREHRKYKRMYYRLFNCYLDAINSQTKEQSDEILKKAQLDCEALYIGGEKVFKEYFLSDERTIIDVLNLAKSIEERKPVEYIDYQNLAEIEDWIEELKSEMAEPPEPVRKLLSALFNEEYE